MKEHVINFQSLHSEAVFLTEDPTYSYFLFT